MNLICKLGFIVFSVITIPLVYSESGKYGERARPDVYYNYVKSHMCEYSSPESEDLFDRVIDAVNIHGTANPVMPGEEYGATLLYPNNPVQGEASKIPLRGGHQVFAKAAELIRQAEREVGIQTFFFDGISTGPIEYIFPALRDLYQRKKREYLSLSTESREGFKPIRVLIIFDIIGTNKWLNLFQLQDLQRGVGLRQKIRNAMGKFRKTKKPKSGVDDCFDINFCMDNNEMDPRIMLLQIRVNRHSTLRSVSHSKSFVIDRQVGIVTGINMVNYHFTDEESPQSANQELMVDHGFMLTGQIAYRLAEDIFFMFWRNTPTKKYPVTSAQKRNGYTDVFSTNIPNYTPSINADDPFSLFHPDNLFASNVAKAAERWRLINPSLIDSVPERKPVRAIFASRTANEVVRSSSNLDLMKKFAITPQNRAFGAVFKYAKREINIVTPSFNSLGFKDFILESVKNGVMVNMLLSKNYQDYNDKFQEMGKNSRAVSSTLKSLQNDIAKSNIDLGKTMGSFNVNWFVTRAGFISGKRAGERFENRIVINEKFYNHNHTKFLCADGQVAIIGSANLDEQSWYNSRELNLVIAGQEIVQAWCKSVFKEDFLRGQEWGEKRWIGQYCWKNEQCANNNCRRGAKGGLVSKSLFTLYQGRCVPIEGEGERNQYCETNEHCRSGKCNRSEFSARNHCN